MQCRVHLFLIHYNLLRKKVKEDIIGRMISLREWDVNSKFDSENLRKFKEVEDRTKRNEDEITREQKRYDATCFFFIPFLFSLM